MKSKTLWKLAVVSLAIASSSVWAKTEKYVLEYSDEKSFSKPYYENYYDSVPGSVNPFAGCEEYNRQGEKIKKGEDNDCFADTPTGRTETYKTKAECTPILDGVLKENTGKYLDKNKDSIVFLMDDSSKRYMRCIAYDFDKLLD